MSAPPQGAAERGRLRILVVDDDPSIARLARHLLVAQGFSEPAHVTTGREALVSADSADLVLLDQQLPDAAGLDLLETLRARPRPPAIVLVTAHGNESLAAQALRQGADDYLAKDQAFAELLPQVVERVRRTRALHAALAASEQELVRAERLAAIGELVVTLHHEINNPLMAASAEVELLLATAGDPARPGLAAIKTSLDRIRDILRRIRDLRDPQSTEYLSGLRMLDLSGGGAVRTVARGTAVVAVLDETVARVASLLLRTAGFTIVRAETEAQLEQASAAAGVTLVLFSVTGSAPGSDPLGRFNPTPGRRYKTVALVAGAGGAAAATGADHLMRLPFDPATFVGEILGVLEKA